LLIGVVNLARQRAFCSRIEFGVARKTSYLHRLETESIMATPLAIGDHVKWVSGACLHFGTLDSFREPALAIVRAKSHGHFLTCVELERLSLDS
jgi:hypothetical protein